LENILFLDLLLFQMLNAYPFLEGKQNRRNIDTFRRIAKITEKTDWIFWQSITVFFFREKPICWHQIYSTKNFGEML